MIKHLKIAIKMALVTLVLLGIVYPFAVTGIAQTIFPDQANGSLIRDPSGKVVGSALIAQKFVQPGYFHPRPSAVDYDAANSGGSNLGPTSRTLRDRVASYIDLLTHGKGLKKTEIPIDSVTTSASGLDPDITPANAESQVARVARARGLSVDEVRKLVRANTTGRQFAFLGEARVNVLKLNLALDGLKPASPQ